MSQFTQHIKKSMQAGLHACILYLGMRYYKRAKYIWSIVRVSGRVGALLRCRGFNLFRVLEDGIDRLCSSRSPSYCGGIGWLVLSICICWLEMQAFWHKFCIVWRFSRVRISRSTGPSRWQYPFSPGSSLSLERNLKAHSAPFPNGIVSIIIFGTQISQHKP